METDTSTEGELGTAVAGFLASGLELFRERHPEAYEKLLAGARRLASGTGPDDWQAVGLACRDAHISFANSVYSPDFLQEGEPAPATDHSNRKIEITLAHFGQMAGSDELRDVVKKLWTYAVRLHHDQTATAGDAERCLALMAVALSDVAGLIKMASRNESWVEKYGVYKCPVCGSTDLAEDVIVDVDSDGMPSGTTIFVCSKCHWMA